MTDDPDSKLRALIAGGGVAGLETALALRELAGDRTAVTVIAPNRDFVYRPMTVGEPFSYSAARHYPLAKVVADAGGELVADELAWVDPAARVVHTHGEKTLAYDALVLATGARARPRYEHAITIDDAHMDETLHGLIQDVEGGYTRSIAFLSPGRMAWQLPLYELAMMTAGRAYDMNVEVAITIITPEDRPLAIFGTEASDAVSEHLARLGIEHIGPAWAEVPATGEVVVNPGDRRLRFERVVALPELYGSAIRGVPLGDDGFLRVDPYGRVREVEHIYAAGDAVDFPIKHGGVGSQLADAAAQSIAREAGAPLTPEPFDPVIHGMLLTDNRPLYLTAKITGGHGFSSEVATAPTWAPGAKIAARYLAPYLEALATGTAAGSGKPA
jgi:sulfide:quinone oxidoreductase